MFQLQKHQKTFKTRLSGLLHFISRSIAIPEVQHQVKTMSWVGYIPNSVGPLAKEMIMLLCFPFFALGSRAIFGYKMEAPSAREPKTKQISNVSPFAELISFQSFPSRFSHLWFSSLLPSKPSQIISETDCLANVTDVLVAHGIKMYRMGGVEPSPALAYPPVLKTPPGPQEREEGGRISYDFLTFELLPNCPERKQQPKTHPGHFVSWAKKAANR